MEKLLKEYAEVREEREKIEALESKIKDKILDAMKKDDAVKVEADFGTFSRATRLSWTYSKAVVKKEEDLKILKEKEQKKGIAKSTATEYLAFRKPSKEEK